MRGRESRTRQCKATLCDYSLYTSCPFLNREELDLQAPPLDHQSPRFDHQDSARASSAPPRRGGSPSCWRRQRVLHPSPCLLESFFIDNLLVRIHFIIVMIRWTGLAPWELELPFPGSLTSTFLLGKRPQLHLYRCRANMAHIRQSRPDRGLGVQVKVLETF